MGEISDDVKPDMLSWRAVQVLMDLHRGLEVQKHRDQKASWSWAGRLRHRVFVSWRCPACRAERRGEKGKQ